MRNPGRPNQVHEIFDSVGDERPPPPGADISAEQWLRSKGATARQLAVADVCYANDFGASLGQLGLREMITENNKWVAACVFCVCVVCVYLSVSVVCVSVCVCRRVWGGRGG